MISIWVKLRTGEGEGGDTTPFLTACVQCCLMFLIAKVIMNLLNNKKHTHTHSNNKRNCVACFDSNYEFCQRCGSQNQSRCVCVFFALLGRQSGQAGRGAGGRQCRASFYF